MVKHRINMRNWNCEQRARTRAQCVMLSIYRIQSIDFNLRCTPPPSHLLAVNYAHKSKFAHVLARSAQKVGQGLPLSPSLVYRGMGFRIYERRHAVPSKYGTRKPHVSCPVFFILPPQYIRCCCTTAA